jgi:hypothetical protein
MRRLSDCDPPVLTFEMKLLFFAVSRPSFFAGKYHICLEGTVPVNGS